MVGGDPPPGGTAEGNLVIRLERVSMPDGLRAVARRDPHGDLIIYISDTLDAESARAAVQGVIRASRRARWRAGLPPVGVALLVALRQVLRGGAGTLRAQRAAWATAATALAASGGVAAVFLTPAPHHHVAAAPVRPHVRMAPGHHSPAAAGSHPAQAQPAAATPSGSSPGPASSAPASPAPGRSPARPPSPSPSPSSSPSPSLQPPSPSPSPSPSDTCVPILVIRACVSAASLSARA